MPQPQGVKYERRRIVARGRRAMAVGEPRLFERVRRLIQQISDPLPSLHRAESNPALPGGTGATVG